MAFDSLIGAGQLFDHLKDPNWVIIDCDFELDAPNAGWEAYLEGHIPGALYAHLENHLSGKVIPGKTSRHPLPEIDLFTQALSNWGIDENVQVVVYDNRGGGIAARLWWMLKWLGHSSAALLDGGLASWKTFGFPLEKSIPNPHPKIFKPSLQPESSVSLQDIINGPRSKLLLIDSRAPERYHGETETIDPIAGHIPGAINAFYMDNLDEDQKFLSKAMLAERFTTLLEGNSPTETVFYRGSGVTAAHNILAMYYAGLGLGKLFPGSWSEWITDPKRPIEFP